MRKFLIALLIVALTQPIYGTSSKARRGAGLPAAGGGGGSCAPATGDLVHETFNTASGAGPGGLGYDLTWTEPATGGGTAVMDENNTSFVANACVATEVVRSFGGASTLKTARARSDFTATDPVYVRAYVYIDAESLDNSETRNILGFTSQSSSSPDATGSIKVMLTQDSGGNLLFELRKNVTVQDSVAASLDTWYRIEIKMDNGVGSDWKVCLAGAATCNSEGTGATDPAFTGARIHIGQDAAGSTGFGYDGYIDNVDVCSGTWCGE